MWYTGNKQSFKGLCLWTTFRTINSFCVQAEQGKICTENNIEQTVSKGDIVFINSSILFSLRQQENFSIKRIAFNGNFVTNYLQYFDFNQAVVFVPKSDEVLTHLILRMTAICTIKTIYKILLICTILSVYAVKVMFHQNPLFWHPKIYCREWFWFYKTKHIVNKYRLFTISEITQNFNNGA